ncbi:MAG TPA: hypothetical protein PKC45_08580, partial [Gemmatales bacterium]|nr:hypothetical protein [Gemmatales bacterium]
MAKRLHIALVYNAFRDQTPEAAEDRGGSADLRAMIRRIARNLRKLGHTVTVVGLADELFTFQRKLRRLLPDVVFNQYDDVVHGALYEMRLAALVRMMGFPITGSPALALGLCRYKYTTACLLAGAGVPVPPDTEILPTVRSVDQRHWHFPVIVQASREHAGIGTDRNSVVHSKTALREKVRSIIKEFNQPALAQAFLPGREYNVGLVGGSRLRVMPLAEVDYSELPDGIPPIMSYAAKYASVFYGPYREAIGSALSTVRRAAEAVALRMMLTDAMRAEAGLPTVLLGVLNDSTLSVT